MSDPLLQSCLKALADKGRGEASRALLEAVDRDLLRCAENGFELALHVGSAGRGDEDTPALIVLEHLMTQARMNQENGGADGTPFLEALEAAIAKLSEENRVTFAGVSALGRCYVRAGLRPPPVLQGEELHADPGIVSMDFPDLDGLLDNLRDEARGDAYALHAALSEMLASVDPAAQAAIISEIARRGEPLFDRLMCYWVLDARSDVRCAITDVVLDRAKNRSLDAVMLQRLMEMRPWLPNDAASDLLDQAIGAAIRGEPAGGVEPRPWSLQRVLASIPDGAGAQSIAVVVRHGKERGVAMLLLKQGFGVKDAYVVACDNAKEQEQLLAQMAHEVEMIDVSQAFLEPALAAALAENQAIAEPPAHGLLDVAEICGLRGLRPRATGVDDWVARLDPDGAINKLSPQKLGRLINASANWPQDYEIIESWYEDSAAVEELLSQSTTQQSRERAFWRHMETRRDWWARIIAKSAATLSGGNNDDRDDWQSFAATALALIHGRPLRKVPLMRRIIENSVEMATIRWIAAPGDMGPAGPMSEVPADHTVKICEPAAEDEGELKRFMNSASMTITPDWLDGYLAAIVVAPSMISPSEWLGSILEHQHDFSSKQTLQRFLDLVLHRYNLANSGLSEAEATTVQLKNMSKAAFGDWIRGFAECVELNGRQWNARALRQDDKAMLKHIASAAKSQSAKSELETILPAWLSRRYALRG